jgi:tetratricopeptide (TPR) repeat protein
MVSGAAIGAKRRLTIDFSCQYVNDLWARCAAFAAADGLVAGPAEPMILHASILAASLAFAGEGAHQALVERYRAGDRTALDALWRLDADAVRAEVLWLRKLAARLRGPREEAFYQAYPFHAAVRAHTELYLRAHEAEDQRAIDDQEEHARGFLEAARERLPALGAQWRLFMAVHHLERLELETAERFATDLTHEQPHQARSWLAAGAVSQAAARFAPHRPWRAPVTLADQVRQRMGEAAARRALLQEAQRQLARALQLDPALHEAVVRLAQVKEALGDAAGAAAALERVPQGVDRALDYVATLLRGRSQAALGRPADAVTSYRAATRLLPGAESAWLALAHALHALGDARGAEAALDRVLAADDVRAARDPFRMFPIFCAGGSRALWVETGGEP